MLQWKNQISDKINLRCLTSFSNRDWWPCIENQFEPWAIYWQRGFCALVWGIPSAKWENRRVKAEREDKKRKVWCCAKTMTRYWQQFSAVWTTELHILFSFYGESICQISFRRLMTANFRSKIKCFTILFASLLGQ